MTAMTTPVFLTVILALPAAAQQVPARPGGPVGPHAMEVQLADRWMHGRQQSRFTPFRESDQWLFIDSVRLRDASEDEVQVPPSPGSLATTGGIRSLFLRLDEHSSGTHVTVVTYADGRPVRIATTPRVRAGSASLSRDHLVRLARRELRDDAKRLSLPASRVWEVVPTFHPARLRAGERWTDSIAFVTEQDGSRQALNGTRLSTLLGDTIVNGRRLWIVNDSADIRYEERAMEEERTLDTLVAVERTVSGYMRGRMLYDPQLGLFRTRADSAVLAGTAVLRYPDGRSFQTPARYERRRQWNLYDPSAYNARQRAIGAERERTMSEGMVITPASDIDRRLSLGDVVLRDSLVRAWQRSTDPNERAGTYNRLWMWGGRDRAFMRRLDDLRVDAGDSVHLLARLADRAYVSRGDYASGVDSATMRLLITLMANPGALFAFGASRDVFYENLQQALLGTPAAIIADTTRWPCLPAACRLLANQWSVATEPRLKVLGLVAHFVLDPRRWTDTVLAYASKDSTPLRGALTLARGIGATWQAATNAPIPSPGADWRAWAEWMNGQKPEFKKRSADLARRLGRSPAEPIVRFEGSHANAIRFTQVRTGRDIVGELKQQRAAATSDTAQLVFEYLLVGLGEYHPTAASVAAHLRSRSAARIALGASQLPSLFNRSSPLADSATATLLLDQLIAMTVAGGKPWRQLRAPDDSSGAQMSALPPREVQGEKTLLLADSLPAAVRAKWATRVSIITAEDWKRRSEREGGTLFTLSSVARVGPFALLGIDSHGRIERRADQAPWLYYASTTYYLMELEGEWVIVTISAMVT